MYTNSLLYIKTGLLLCCLTCVVTPAQAEEADPKYLDFEYTVFGGKILHGYKDKYDRLITLGTFFVKPFAETSDNPIEEVSP